MLQTAINMIKCVLENVPEFSLIFSFRREESLISVVYRKVFLFSFTIKIFFNYSSIVFHVESTFIYYVYYL